VLFGSDGPWADAGVEIAQLKNIGLTGDELGMILSSNARALFGI
jgi:predicted TIM-barrel fold metal-dependent hydrolase